LQDWFCRAPTLIRRSLGAEPELKYYVSNADAETPLATLALVACTP
jgi:hypothetical protein